MKNKQPLTKLSLATLICLQLISITACKSTLTPKNLLVTMPVISMTKTSYTPNHPPKEIGPVVATFCLNETPLSSKALNVGIIDELVTRAQKVDNSDFIKNAQIFQEGAQCFSIEGIAAK